MDDSAPSICIGPRCIRPQREIRYPDSHEFAFAGGSDRSAIVRRVGHENVGTPMRVRAERNSPKSMQPRRVAGPNAETDKGQLRTVAVDDVDHVIDDESRRAEARHLSQTAVTIEV
jgi:hypothetical protein